MDNATENTTALLYIKQHKTAFIIVLAAVLLVTLLIFIWVQKAGTTEDSSAGDTSGHHEFDPDMDNSETPPDTPVYTEDEIEDKLREAQDAIEKANADYQAEMEARERDKRLLEDTQEKVTELESEIERLLAQLDAKQIEMDQKIPPELNVMEIVGMYEAKGELVTLTYRYEVTIRSETDENMFIDKTLLYQIPGSLKIGVNFDHVKNGITVDDSKKTVTLTVPAAYFIANEIDETNVERYDVKRGLFSKVEDKDYLAVAGEAKAKAQEQMTANSMLVYAQNLAGLEFMGLLEPLTSRSGYKIVVEYEK